MAAPTPRLLPDSPIEVISSEALFRGPSRHQRSCGSLIRLESGRVLMSFRYGSGPKRANDGSVMITHSDDNGVTWEEPLPVYAKPGSDAIPMGGLAYFSDDLIKLVLGHITYDASLGGEEPISDWLIAMTESRDGGKSWGPIQPEIRLFPHWTEMYGTSNPHLLSDGSYMFAVMGTLGRDTGWHSGVSFSSDFGETLSPPVIIAQEPERDYSDIDIVRLDDGRFLAVVREHLTRISVFSHSSDEGKTWTPIRPTGFKGANFKLLKLRSGAILATYRDGGGARHGVSCSITRDGGETWEFVGQLYVADPDTDDVTSAMGVPCGYPDMIYTGEREILGVLHTFADRDGHVDLHLFQLRDLT
jgi:hypothetical protein